MPKASKPIPHARKPAKPAADALTADEVSLVLTGFALALSRLFGGGANEASLGVTRTFADQVRIFGETADEPKIGAVLCRVADRLGYLASAAAETLH